MRIPRQYVVVAAVALCIGCKSGASGSSILASSRTSSVPRTRDIITKDELSRATGSIYDVVQTLRPSWLNKQPFGSGVVPVAVYVDMLPISRDRVEVLREMLPQYYAQVQYYSPMQALNRFGFAANQNASVIQVLTK
jgi:hypothetical protein